MLVLSSQVTAAGVPPQSPVVSPVWFIVDNKDIVFTTMNSALKCEFMQRDPRVSICVDEEIITLPLPELLPWTTKIAARYVADSLIEQFGNRNAVEGEVLVRINLTKVFACKGVAE
jgi:hypothetical protein